MRTFRTVVLLGVTLTCFAGARPAPFTLQGRAWDRVTGAPIGDATVSLVVSRRSAVTGADGTFTFADLQIGASEQLQIAHDEYRTVRLSLGALGSGARTLEVALTRDIAKVENPGAPTR